MKLFALLLIPLSFLGGICRAADPAADFFVSPSGSDAWSGTLPEPNADRTDGPFATLERARDAVRKSATNRTDNVLVLIRGGTYQLDETVVFGLEDSGPADTTVTYAAYPGEKPVFSSGRKITGWKRVTSQVPGLPKEAIGKIRVADVSGKFHTLFDKDGILRRARSKGFIPMEGGSRNRLRFPAGRLKNWDNIEDFEIVVRPHHAWIVNILPLKSVDEKNGIAHTTINATYAMNRLHFLKQTESCWVENTLEELDELGEWVLNTKQGKLYLWPRSDREVWAPQLTELVRVEGKVDKEGPRDQPVRNLCFRGLTFMHGDRYQLSSDDAGLQHDWEMHDKANALMRLRGTENCHVENCRFAHSGSGAIRVDLHGKYNTITGNQIEHLGGTGILLCGYGPGTKDVNRKNLVYNNHIHHIGRIYWHSPGIMVWQSGENRVANNLVHHTPYSGIIISGCMTDFFRRQGRELSKTIRRHEVGRLPKQPKPEEIRPFLHSHDNVIEYNEIHHAMEMLGDGNGIYIRGAGPGNVIRRNYIHHLVAPMKMQSAIRTDGGQRDTRIVENLIYKCTSQGIILKLNNRCENNIIADIIAPPRGYYLSVREGPMTGATIKRNVFYSSSETCTFIDELPPGKGRTTEDRRGRKLARSKQAETDENIYFCASDPRLGQEMLAKQQQDGVDLRSLAVDPLFVDPAKGDFRFKPDSPALKLGIKPFDLSLVGLRKTNHSHYPEFSWDKVPIAFHFGKSEGLLTKEEAKFVASRSNFTCLEKGHALKTHGSTEAGIEAEAVQLKELNPKIKVLFYWNTFLDYPMYEAHQEYSNRPQWWLKTRSGKLDLKKGRLKRYDLANAEFRDWWTDIAAKAVRDKSCDGVFMDAFPQIASQANRKLWGDEKYAAIQNGLTEIIKETRQKIGADKLIVYNGVRSTPRTRAGFEYQKHIDGAMIEHFGFFQSSSKEMMLQDILEMQRAAKAGKLVVLKGWAGFTFADREAMQKSLAEKRRIAKDNLTFPLACFLAGAQKNCYFIYNWGYRVENGCLEWYPEFDKPLGEPLGEMTRDGWKLSRQYKHASVWVDLESKKAKIIWR